MTDNIQPYPEDNKAVEEQSKQAKCTSSLNQ
jgi:hypothetical protein